jgi:hypothetical protein
MTAITRKSIRCPVSTVVTLATADDLDGTIDNTQAYDVTGADRVIIEQVNNGTNGTAGIDCIEVSHDNGVTWTASLTVLPIAEDDATGAICLAGVLNVAGAEPTTSATFKCGPYVGQTAIRCGRKTSTITSMDTYIKTLTGGTTWITGSPTVRMYAIGLTTGAPTALA